MKITTLCYIRNGNKTLMLYRNKKENDENAGKWVGIGGKLEAGESPEECLEREITEETGIEHFIYSFRGIVTFVSNKWGSEYMCLFTAYTDTFDTIECNEGKLEWIDTDKLLTLPMWEGDRIFLEIIQDTEQPFFSLKLIYDGDTLTKAILDGEEIDIKK